MQVRDVERDERGPVPLHGRRRCVAARRARRRARPPEQRGQRDVPDQGGTHSARWTNRVGSRRIVHGRSYRVERRRTTGAARRRSSSFPGKVILDFGPRDTGKPFALGSDQFVARLDGTTWVQEHEGHSPAPDRRRGQYSDDLFAAGYLETTSDAPLVAFGPYAVLTRQSNGSWTSPADSDRARLRDLAILGPQPKELSGCAGAGWLWLGRNLGWVTCEDNRAFLRDADKIEPLGKLPGGCRFQISASAFARGTVYAGCGSRGLWKSTGGGWQSVPAPKGVRSISLTTHCMFVATRRAIWRKCEAGNLPAT